MRQAVGPIVSGRIAYGLPQAAAVAGEWTVVKEWSGENGLTETERFTTGSRIFRISWKSSELDRGGILDIYVRDNDRRLVVLAAGLQDHVKRATSGAFIVNSEPGVYYIEIRGTGVKWHLAVEQPKG